MSGPEIITFGCRLNSFESEIMRAHAQAAELDDLVVVHSCAVTAEAERQARQAIRRARRDHPHARIVVTGGAGFIGTRLHTVLLDAGHEVLIVDDLRLGDTTTTGSARDGASIVKIPPTGVALEEVERLTLIEALKMSNWVQKDAAELLSMEADYEAARLLTLQAAWMADNRKPNSIQASMAKAKAGRACTDIALRCVRLCGSVGYGEAELLEKWARDAKILDIFEGTQQIQLLIIARQMLGKTSADLR